MLTELWNDFYIFFFFYFKDQTCEPYYIARNIGQGLLKQSIVDGKKCE